MKTIPFDAAPYLTDPAAQAELLDDALQSGNAAYVGEALAVIVRARGLALSADPRPGANSLQSLRSDAEPQLSTLFEVARDLGLRLHVVMEAAE